MDLSSRRSHDVITVQTARIAPMELVLTVLQGLKDILWSLQQQVYLYTVELDGQ